MTFPMADQTDGRFFDAYVRGQYLSPGGNGGYVQVPVAFAVPAQGESDTSLGNLQIGALHVTHQDAVDITLLDGVALPTGPDTLDSMGLGPAAVVLSQASARPADYLMSFGGTWVRGEVQARATSGDLQLGGGLGFEVPVESWLDDEGNVDAVMLATGGMGYVASSAVGVGLGVSMLHVFGDGVDGAGVRAGF